jgi:cation-transporting ATPase 13A1
MWYGLVLVTGVAFSCATEFVPEINTKLKLVPFSTQFKLTLTTLMIIDYAGCWAVEYVFKRAFSDYRPKDIAVRRPDQLERERKRKQAEKEAEERKLEEEAREKELALASQ